MRAQAVASSAWALVGTLHESCAGPESWAFAAQTPKPQWARGVQAPRMHSRRSLPSTLQVLLPLLPLQLESGTAGGGPVGGRVGVVDVRVGCVCVGCVCVGCVRAGAVADAQAVADDVGADDGVVEARVVAVADVALANVALAIGHVGVERVVDAAVAARVVAVAFAIGCGHVGDMDRVVAVVDDDAVAAGVAVVRGVETARIVSDVPVVQVAVGDVSVVHDSVVSAGRHVRRAVAAELDVQAAEAADSAAADRCAAEQRHRQPRKWPARRVIAGRSLSHHPSDQSVLR